MVQEPLCEKKVSITKEGIVSPLNMTMTHVKLYKMEMKVDFLLPTHLPSPFLKPI